MKLEEGPLFGALIIGGGIGFLVWQKYQNPGLAIAVGLGLVVADYAFLLIVKKIFKK